MADTIAALSPERLDAVLAQLEELRYSRLALYTPYPKQRIFHDAGATYRERLLRAGNQLGKTWCGAAEMAYHLTGDYPPWWRGRVFGKPVAAWAGGKDSLTVRDSVTRLLLGPPDARGTGYIPKDCIIDIAPSRGVADGVDNATVKHTGGRSRLTFKTYDQGRERWQAATLDLVWFDEEPSEDIYSEGLTRTNASGGMVYMTFTPLLGMSKVVMRFLTEQSPDRSDTNMTIDDALHITPERRRQIVAAYAPHELEARIMGTPVLGSGRIFPIAEDDIACEPFVIPDYYPRLGAMDFGWDHPFAAVEIAHDTEADIVYVTKGYRVREKSPAHHAIALKPWGLWLPWSWPRDGRRETLEGAGLALAKQFGDVGLNMHGTHAQFGDGSVSVEAGIMDMLDRMQSGRFKVFRHLNDWFEEFRLYHRKDGLVVKEMDDLMAATRYGVMMLRHAECPPRLFRKAAVARQSDPLAAYR